MKYQLTIQFSKIQYKSLDYFIDLEECLLGKISKEHDVDGHDLGNDTFTIFMFTNNPKTALDQINKIFSEITSSLYTVAYREVDKDEYTVIWPEKRIENFKIL